jgi:ribosomal protein S18 acetylase RimI-like enzyme
VQIRVCRSGDEDTLALVGQATFLETYAGILPGSDIVAHCRREHAAAVYRTWLEGGARAWLAETLPGGAPVGYVVVAPASLPVPDPKDDDLEVKRIYVLQQFHGRGVGRRLMLEAVRYATDAGASRLLLGVFHQNARALAFYASFGFQPVGERRFRVGDHDYDDFVLALPLPSAAIHSS